ncbi:MULTISPECIES: siderophore-interacting protein [unclassified Sphingomonas]|uniref:siderophore-interacting protein n=1 Tax=unclassified Sphingomonas TaxID=196159 RepID=UPI002269AED4|nr:MULTISPECIES: siderophore-interacting protein [unclassified Sphingomonas]
MTMRERRIERVRHDTRRRSLTVETVVRLTPHMLRIGFTSDDLDGFISLSFDDHIKLFLPVEDGGPSQMRDYTPRRFDVATGRVTIDFALHDAGVATSWARAARPGERVDIGGPRGSAIIPADLDWYWLIGDETALPAIGRWVEEAASRQAVTTFVVVEQDADRQVLQTQAEWTGRWVVRTGDQGDAALLRALLAAHHLPVGDGFVWIAAEASVARILRDWLVAELGYPRERIKAGGYWIRGRADAHDRLRD